MWTIINYLQFPFLIFSGRKVHSALCWAWTPVVRRPSGLLDELRLLCSGNVQGKPTTANDEATQKVDCTSVIIFLYSFIQTILIYTHIYFFVDYCFLKPKLLLATTLYSSSTKNKFKICCSIFSREISSQFIRFWWQCSRVICIPFQLYVSQ